MAAIEKISGEPHPRRRLMLLSLCLGAFMATLDTSIVNIALPQIAGDFRGSLPQISWVMLIYLLANVSLLLPSGRLGDMLAPGRLYLLGLLLFTGASALCGLSPNLPWMVAARALQGVGASLMLGVAPKIIYLVFGPGRRGTALGFLSTAFAAGISVGAPLGGLITSHLGWRYIFFINIPICFLASLLGRRSLAGLPTPLPWDRKSFDLGGALLLAGALSLLLLGLTWLREPGRNGWPLAALGGAAVLALLLVWWERRQASPMLHPELWRSLPFVAGSLAVVLTFAAVMGTFFLLPFFLDQIYRFTPDQAGLLLAALSFTNAAVAPLGGYLADRLGNLFILRLGSGLILAGLSSLALAGPDLSPGHLAARLALIGLGFGMFQAPNLNEILQGVRPPLAGLAAAANAVLKNLGALLGISLIVAVYSGTELPRVFLREGTSLAIAPFRIAFAATGLAGGLALLVNLLPRRLPGGSPRK